LDTALHPAGLPSDQPLLQTNWLWTLLAEPWIGVPKTRLFLLGSYGWLQMLFPQKRISLPAHLVAVPKRRRWTLLAEPRPFGGPKTKLFLLRSCGWLQTLFPQRRISLPAHQVDAPKRRLIGPIVLRRR
jgi:hypothetical protein